VDVTIVVPVYNEVDNIAPLYDAVTSVMATTSRSYELLIVDDGSTDGTVQAISALAATDARVRVVRFRRNFGQTAAMHAGLQLASGEAIVTLDGDLQNEPGDIPALLAKLDEGYDVVHGWRRQRQDAWLNRKLPSKIANWVISRVTGFEIHDLGCTLKAMRREIAQELELYGEMHRFIPILAHWRGARCVEIETRHHPRRFGQTKYGIGRTTRVILDLVTVKFMLQYFASPMKLFGRIGLWSGVLSAISAAATLGMKFVQGIDMTGNPLLLAAVTSGLAAIQFLSLGLLGEVAARIYFGQSNRSNYAIRELINFDEHPSVQPADRRAA
jgi:glycosyltransferase involved in cell wall biosynthesis